MTQIVEQQNTIQAALLDMAKAAGFTEEEFHTIQAALEKAIQERDNALRLEQAAQARADREAAARQAAERRAEKRGRRLFGSRKEEPDTQEIK